MHLLVLRTPPDGVLGFTVDHKKIGIMYGVVAMFWFLWGGVEALLIRAQLFHTERHRTHGGAIQPDFHHARNHNGVPRDYAPGSGIC